MAVSKHRILNDQAVYPDGAGGERTVTAGAVVDDVPKESLTWLIEQGHVESVPANTTLREGDPLDVELDAEPDVAPAS